MRTITTTKTIATYDELSPDAQEKVLEKMWDINVDYQWWEFVYADAEDVGLKITAFDIDRGAYVKATFTNDACYTANKILTDHGETCSTYLTAETFLADRDAVVDSAERDEYGDLVDEYALDQELDDLEDEFLKSLCEDYRLILEQEYEYKTSREAIEETIRCNNYEFDMEDYELA